jgi:hypothetical protein
MAGTLVSARLEPEPEFRTTEAMMIAITTSRAEMATPTTMSLIRGEERAPEAFPLVGVEDAMS